MVCVVMTEGMGYMSPRFWLFWRSIGHFGKTLAIYACNLGKMSQFKVGGLYEG